ncbi:hypothetical protein S7711_08187 [Stachybotrys chartarum IBT 7711]|uniref:Uncharacterized protein n=1 Tax=Stachybotrys chartarum (strain CBS 109288 / IBT 7711) TaxID=1280523 RepID=A0A084ANM9_STACB|nr:hypothetical protein S7711_08187 [Stachybotrys chartarum IBT 7711]
MERAAVLQSIPVKRREKILHQKMYHYSVIHS